MRLDALHADGGRAGGEVRQTGSAEGPILVDSNVDTDGDNGDAGSEPDGSFTVGPASSSPARSSGRPSRFTGRQDGSRHLPASRPVRGAARRDGRTGLVGHVFRVYKGPLGLAVELGSAPSLPPPPPGSRDQASRRRVTAPAGIPPPKRHCTGGDWPQGPLTAQSPPEGAFLAAIGRLATKTRRGKGPVA